MYSMQMTGYMFRSAEYRRSLMESLGAAGESSGLLPPEAGEDETREEESEPPAQLPQAWPRLVRVRVRVRVTNPNRNRNRNSNPQRDCLPTDVADFTEWLRLTEEETQLANARGYTCIKGRSGT